MPDYGALIPTGRTPSEVRVHAPTECANGHALRGNVVITQTSCSCPAARHLLWQCRTCGHVTTGPAHEGEPLDPTAGGMHSAYDALPRGQWGPTLDVGEG